MNHRINKCDRIEGVRFLESLQSQRACIGTMNRKMRKLLIIKQGIFRFMESVQTQRARIGTMNHKMRKLLICNGSISRFMESLQAQAARIGTMNQGVWFVVPASTGGSFDQSDTPGPLDLCCLKAGLQTQRLPSADRK